MKELKNKKDNTFEINKSLAKWPQTNPHFWKQMRTGVLSHIFGPNTKEQKLEIQTFFQSHYKQVDQLVCDGNTNGFLSQLNELGLFNVKTSHILDLGCGNGSLYRYIKDIGVDIPQYTGLDFAVSGKRLDSRAIICNIDLRNSQAVNLLANENTIFAINTFCYLESLSNIPVLKSSGRKTNNYLLVVDPWPGLFWERHFNGIWPTYRSPEKLIKEMSEIGWKPNQQVNYYLVRLFGKFFFPLSYGLSFKSNMSDENDLV